eukprot:476689_1
MYIWLPIIMVAVNGISSDNFAEISFTPVRNTEIGEIELFDTIEVEFDLKLTAVPPGSWVNILQIGEDATYAGYPSIFMRTNTMRIHYAYNTNQLYSFDINLPSNQIDDTFHIYGYFSNSEIKFYFNGVEAFQKSDNYFHDLYTGIKKIYGSNWGYGAAGVEVTNLCITSYRPDFTKHIKKEDAAVEFDGPLIPTRNANPVGESLAIYNEIEIEFDLTINNPVAAGWHNIFQIGNDHTYAGHPALFIKSDGVIRVHWAYNANRLFSFDPVRIKDESGKKYHIYLKLNHGLILFEINGVITYEVKGTAYYFNNYKGNHGIYASNSGYVAADVTITNFRARTNPLTAKKYLNDATSDICNAGPIKPTQNNQIGSIDIKDIVEIEFDMELNAVQLGGWRNIIQIDDDHHEGNPSIFISATTIRVHWGYNLNYGFAFDSVININEAGEIYHIYGKFSDSEIKFVINDIESKSEIGKYYFENSKSSNAPIFASNKAYLPADVTITNLCIKSTDISRQYIDPADADFCIDEIEPFQNNQIGSVDIDDIIEIEFNMKFNKDIPGGWQSIIQIGDASYQGNPSIFIHATRLRFHFALDSNSGYSTDAIIGNKAGNNYHIYAKYTHDSIYININGVIEQNLTKYFDGYSYYNSKGAAKPIYLSNPTYTSADLLIHGLCIKSYAAKPISIVRNLECDYTFPVCSSNEALDIIFLMDESGSIDENEWGIIVNFVNRLIEYDVNDNSYVSLFEYSSTTKFQQFSNFILSNNNGKQSLINAMNNNPWVIGGYTFTGDAMIKTIKTFNDYNANNDANNDRNNVLFLITDGEPTDTVCTTELYSLLSISDIRIVLIGVGSGLTPDTWTNSMDCLVNHDGSNVFYVAQFDSDAFNEIEAELRQITCVDTTVTIGSNVNSYIFSNLFWKYLTVLCVIVMVLTTFIVIIKHNCNKSKLYNKVKVIDDYDSDVEQQKVEINQ